MGKNARTCADCGCRLSQYNLEDRCAACSRDRRLDADLCPSIPAEVWIGPDIQNAIAHWDFGLASRLIRERAGLRQDDMAFMTGLSQSFLSMLEAGNRRLTNLDKAARFLQGIGTPDALLAPPFREHPDSSMPGQIPHSGTDRVSTRPAARDNPDLSDLAAQAAVQSLHFTDEIAKTNVSDVELEGLEFTLTQIASDYVHAPLRRIFTDLVTTRDRLFALLTGRQPVGQTRELLLLAGTSCLLLAHASQNLGDEDAAIAQLQTAWSLAEQADHNDLRAWVKGTAALIAEWSTRRQTALDYTRQAIQLAPGGQTRIRIAAIEARAAARIGDRTTALGALENLHRAREQSAALMLSPVLEASSRFPRRSRSTTSGEPSLYSESTSGPNSTPPRPSSCTRTAPRSTGHTVTRPWPAWTSSPHASWQERSTEPVSSSSPSWNSRRTGGSGNSATPCGE